MQGVTEPSRPERVASALPAFADQVAARQRQTGVGAARTTLIGFLQGAITALESTQQPDRPPIAGRVIAIACRFSRPPRHAPAGVVANLMYGDEERVMPVDRAVEAERELRALGAVATQAARHGAGPNLCSCGRLYPGRRCRLKPWSNGSLGWRWPRRAGSVRSTTCRRGARRLPRCSCCVSTCTTAAIRPSRSSNLGRRVWAHLLRRRVDRPSTNLSGARHGHLPGRSLRWQPVLCRRTAPQRSRRAGCLVPGSLDRLLQVLPRNLPRPDSLHARAARPLRTAAPHGAVRA
ncbi:MAG: hypothetical protein IT509_03775 [Rhodocyclaceae bacterium]|nr:hypothetical protein [Rhodocyclaceae bacterium]